MSELISTSSIFDLSNTFPFSSSSSSSSSSFPFHFIDNSSQIQTCKKLIIVNKYLDQFFNNVHIKIESQNFTNPECHNAPVKISFSQYKWEYSFDIKNQQLIICIVGERFRPSTIQIPNLFFNLKHLQIKGDFVVDLSPKFETIYDTSLNILLENNAVINAVFLENTETLAVTLLDHSRLNVKGGNIKQIFTVNITREAVLDLSDVMKDSSFLVSSREEERRESGEIEQQKSVALNIHSRCTGFILVPPEMNQQIETPRQRYVREKIKVPSSLKKKNKELSSTTTTCLVDEENICQICFHREIDARLKPCGCAWMCLKCTEKHRTTPFSVFSCPFCRTEINFVEQKI